MKPQKEFTYGSWEALVRKVTVYGPMDIQVTFVDGKTVKA